MYVHREDLNKDSREHHFSVFNWIEIEVLKLWLKKFSDVNFKGDKLVNPGIITSKSKFVETETFWDSIILWLFRLNYIMVVETVTFWDLKYLQLLRPRLSETMNVQGLETKTNWDWTKVSLISETYQLLLFSSCGSIWFNSIKFIMSL